MWVALLFSQRVGFYDAHRLSFSQSASLLHNSLLPEFRAAGSGLVIGLQTKMTDAPTLFLISAHDGTSFKKPGGRGRCLNSVNLIKKHNSTISNCIRSLFSKFSYYVYTRGDTVIFNLFTCHLQLKISYKLTEMLPTRPTGNLNTLKIQYIRKTFTILWLYKKNVLNVFQIENN